MTLSLLEKDSNGHNSKALCLLDVTHLAFAQLTIIDISLSHGGGNHGESNENRYQKLHCSVV